MLKCVRVDTLDVPIVVLRSACKDGAGMGQMGAVHSAYAEQSFLMHVPPAPYILLTRATILPGALKDSECLKRFRGRREAGGGKCTGG